MQKIRTTVHIAGKDYTIASYDTEEYINRVAAHVDRQMSELYAATKLPAAQLAVLTAVNATDDMMKSRDEIRQLRKRIDEAREQNQRLQEQINALQAALAGGENA